MTLHIFDFLGAASVVALCSAEGLIDERTRVARRKTRVARRSSQENQENWQKVVLVSNISPRQLDHHCADIYVCDLLKGKREVNIRLIPFFVEH